MLLKSRINTLNTFYGSLTLIVLDLLITFQQCGILTSVDLDEPVQPPMNLETSNDVQSVA